MRRKQFTWQTSKSKCVFHVPGSRWWILLWCFVGGWFLDWMIECLFSIVSLFVDLVVSVLALEIKAQLFMCFFKCKTYEIMQLHWHSGERTPPPRPNSPLTFNQAAPNITHSDTCSLNVPDFLIKILESFPGKSEEMLFIQVIKNGIPALAPLIQTITEIHWVEWWRMTFTTIFHQVSGKSIQLFLWNLAHKQTNKRRTVKTWSPLRRYLFCSL